MSGLQESDPACSCGHPQHEHEHYRSGNDCVKCSCTGFHRRWLRQANEAAGLLKRLARRLA